MKIPAGIADGQRLRISGGRRRRRAKTDLQGDSLRFHRSRTASFFGASGIIWRARYH